MTEHYEQNVQLPTSEADLMAFMDSLIEEYKLPAGDDTYDAIATMILHLPHTAAYAKRSHFGHGVLKSMANRAAYEKLQELKKRRDAAEEEKTKAELTLVNPEPAPASGEQSI